MNSLNKTFKEVTEDSSSPDSLVSVILLLTGIISSRAGLYIADLTVHQIFQQELKESQRLMNHCPIKMNQMTLSLPGAL